MQLYIRLTSRHYERIDELARQRSASTHRRRDQRPFRAISKTGDTGDLADTMLLSNDTVVYAVVMTLNRQSSMLDAEAL